MVKITLDPYLHNLIWTQSKLIGNDWYSTKIPTLFKIGTQRLLGYQITKVKTRIHNPSLNFISADDNFVTNLCLRKVLNDMVIN